MKVVNLGQVRDLRAEWQKVLQAMDGEKVTDFFVTLRSADGNERVYLGGVYRSDRGAALKAAMSISAARVMTEDEPLFVDSGL
jgi:hypothetical protein